MPTYVRVDIRAGIALTLRPKQSSSGATGVGFCFAIRSRCLPSAAVLLVSENGTRSAQPRPVPTRREGAVAFVSVESESVPCSFTLTS